MLAPLALAALLATAPSAMVRVGPGTARPLFTAPGEEKELHIGAFLLDKRAVTNAEFLSFLRGHPQWRRDRVARLFADENYLSNWSAPLQLSPTAPADAPVVHVSWFAARAYCEARGARLPTENEWELAASADETRADASADDAFQERVLSWYAKPTPAVLPRAGQGKANFWGAQELHGLIWEWVLDFGSSVPDPAAVGSCGGDAQANGDKRDYASFMRAAFRSSLQANYTTSNLGFRCARDLEGATR